jgi:hypothetical protein
MATFESYLVHLADPWEATAMKIRIGFCYFIFGVTQPGVIDPHVLRATFGAILHDSIAIGGINLTIEDVVFQGDITRFLMSSDVPIFAEAGTATGGDNKVLPPPSATESPTPPPSNSTLPPPTASEFTE